MTPAQLLHDLKRCGVVVRIAPDNPAALDLDGPPAMLTPDRLDEVRRCKADMLAILQRRNIRHHVADLIRQARRCRRDCAIALRDAWHERIAIVTVEAGLSEIEAEWIAANELKSIDRIGAGSRY